MQRVLVRRHRYFDSVFLMQLARRLAAQPGMRDAAALMATPANRQWLARLGLADAAPEAGPDDLLVALEGEAAAVAAIAAGLDAWLRPPAGEGRAEAAPRSLAQAVAAHPAANLAVISVPGAHAAREARAALRLGLNVFLFSSGVAVADELALKREAAARGRIVMGPDCGTAWVAGAGIGFANAVRRGPVGAVSAAGTGLQELACLLHRAGSGLSHGIGVGGRDLSDAVGGLSTFAALQALQADPATRAIVVMAKAPGPRTQAALLQRCAGLGKPVVLCLLGAAGPAAGGPPSASLIDDAARLALQAVQAPAGLPPLDLPALQQLARADAALLRPGQREVRGLFAGGSFCAQAQAVFQAAGLPLASNVPIAGVAAMADPWHGSGTALVDMGAEGFVAGRPHPMIDGSLRARRLVEEGRDPAVGLLLLDVVLGANAAPDPVGELLPAIAALQAAGAAPRLAASVCGTEGDAQGRAAQWRALVQAGVRVFDSAAQAACYACELARMARTAGERA